MGEMEIKVGFAMSGSFCTFSKAIPQMKLLVDSGYEVLPIMSETAYSTDTRFGKAEDIHKEIENICGKKIMHTIEKVEPIGPKKMTDIMIIAPCTGNTLSKLANSTIDTAVTMAAKSHLRGQKPLLIALSTNDGLSGSAENMGILLNRKNIYFLPMSQDDPIKKPNSLVAHFDLIIPSIGSAIMGYQIQPIFR